MTINTICILISSISFYVYVIAYFITPHMKNEFKRFNLEKLGLLTIVLEFTGASGLIVGLKYDSILTISSLGLGLLMLCGLIVRIKLKDSIWISLPALFYLCLNIFIFNESIN